MDDSGAAAEASTAADNTAPQSGSVNASVAVAALALISNANNKGEADAAAASGTEDSQSPASPVNLRAVLNRPFTDVIHEIISGFQLKSTAHAAAEQLRYLVVNRDHDQEVLQSPVLLALLQQCLKEGPALPAAGSCMAVIAHLCRTPAGRAQMRIEGVLQPVMKYLGLADVMQKANTQSALMLLQNMSTDKLCRQMILKANGVELLVELLGYNPAELKHKPKLASALTGTLLNLMSAEAELSVAKHTFVDVGGMEVACRVLAEWGRFDNSPAALRLRLLLADLGKLTQYAMRLHETALDACTSARLAHVMAGGGHPNDSTNGQASSGVGAPAGGSAVGSGAGYSLPADVLAGKFIPLGTPRMPASERITAAVLMHGKNLVDNNPVMLPVSEAAES